MSERVDDAAIIARSREEPELFATLFDRHFGVIHGYLERRLGPGLADDLAADVFSLAFESRERFRPVHASARSWLYGIASNHLLRHRRSELRRLRALARLEAMRIDAQGEVESADERLDAASLRRPLFEALARLEARDRDVLLLVAWEGLSYEEVSGALEIPVGTVRSRLNRARKAVRTALAGCEGEGECASLGPMLGGIDA
jgi:RNA polymerase sigma factor (sigma-70 family)